jgi:hypothetical protein
MMTSEVTKRNNGGGLVQLTPEAFAENLVRYGDEMQPRSYVGTLLRFDHGVYKAGLGENPPVVPIGTKLTFALESVEVGWQKWVDKELVNNKTGLLCSGYQPPKRPELGDMDKAMWSTDPGTKQPRDPWQPHARAVLYGSKGDAGMLYTFTTNSRGGTGAIAKLCQEAGKLMRMHRGASPIVTLRADSYKHKVLGTKVPFPVFELTGWNEDPWHGAAIRKED